MLCFVPALAHTFQQVAGVHLCARDCLIASQLFMPRASIALLPPHLLQVQAGEDISEAAEREVSLS